jgi:hypothetical protein
MKRFVLALVLGSAILGIAFTRAPPRNPGCGIARVGDISKMQLAKQPAASGGNF